MAVRCEDSRVSQLSAIQAHREVRDTPILPFILLGGWKIPATAAFYRKLNS